MCGVKGILWKRPTLLLSSFLLHPALSRLFATRKMTYMYKIKEENAFILWLVSATQCSVFRSKSCNKKDFVTKEIKCYMSLICMDLVEILKVDGNTEAEFVNV